jgi:hypothetical protein
MISDHHNACKSNSTFYSWCNSSIQVLVLSKPLLRQAVELVSYGIREQSRNVLTYIKAPKEIRTADPNSCAATTVGTRLNYVLEN